MSKKSISIPTIHFNSPSSPRFDSHFPPSSPTDTIASGFSSLIPFSATFKSENLFPLPTPPTLFCLALYSYFDPDPAILSFAKNDVIEVLSQHPSGWWDGLRGGTWNGYGLGGEVRRGWIPSNYVKLLGGREEALAAMARMGGRQNVRPSL